MKNFTRPIAWLLLWLGCSAAFAQGSTGINGNGQNGGGGAVNSVTGAGSVSCSPTTGAVTCTGSGGGTVSPATGGQEAVYSSTGTVVAGASALPYGTQVGTGLANVFDVTAYGAVCNGLANAAPGINAAIAAAAVMVSNNIPTIVQLPPGYCNITSSILLNTGGISLNGYGPNATYLGENGSFDLINASGAGYATISNLTFKNFNGSNTNWAINNLAGVQMSVLNVGCQGPQNCFNISGGDFTADKLFVTLPNAGIGVQITGSAQVFRVTNSIISGISGTPTACIKITGGATFDLIGNELAHCGTSLLVQPTNSTVFSIKSTENWYDSSTSDSVLLDGSQTGGVITRVMSEGDWFSGSSAGNGLEIKGTVKGVHITDGEFMANAVNGIKIDDNTTATGFSVSGASQLAQNATCGVSVGANVTNWAITDDIIGPAADFTANGTGICVASGTGDYYTINGNNLAGNTTAALTNGATGTHGTIGVNNGVTTGIATFAVGTGVTSVVCATGYSCNNTRGTLTIVGGTATTGTIATVSFSAALSAAPACFAQMNGGVSSFGIGNSAPTASAFNITAAVSVAGATFNVNYQCQS